MAGQTYNTVRDLEKSNARWFRIAGTVALFGLVLVVVGFAVAVVALIGYACLMVGVLMLLVGMLRVIHLSKEPTRHIYCPYCASKNDVFMTKREIPCDICGRRIGITASGEPVPLEPIEDDED